MNPQEIKAVADKFVAYAKRKADAEVCLVTNNTSLTRFANNAISQNVSERDYQVTVRAIVGKRTAQTNVNQFDIESLKSAFQKAWETAKKVKPDALALPLLPRQAYTAVDAYSENTAKAGPSDRAVIVEKIVRQYKSRGAKASGTMSNGCNTVSIFNTNGLFSSHSNTSANLDLTALVNDGAGWAMDSQKDIGAIDVEKVGNTALDKALKSVAPTDCPAGDYTVVLEPGAVSEFLEFLGWVGFGGLAFNEGRSFMSGSIGKKVMNEQVTIIDDAFHPLMNGLPFDFEGAPRQKVVLIEKGIAKNVVHDRITAKKAKSASTGHSLPQPNSSGPITLNLIVDPGNSSIDEMVATTKRGVYVTKFHYVNVIDSKKVVLTGMTRNGTFLIENGKVTRPLKNMRFTESALTAFSNVELISRDVKYVNAFFGGGFVVPAMKIANFTFSSETKF